MLTSRSLWLSCVLKCWSTATKLKKWLSTSVRNGVLLFVSDIAESEIKKMCRHILQCLWRHRHWTSCEQNMDCLQVSFCQEIVAIGSTRPYQIKPRWSRSRSKSAAVKCALHKRKLCPNLLGRSALIIWLFRRPEASHVLADGVALCLECRISRCKTSRHSIQSKSKIIIFSPCYCILLLVPTT